MKGSWEKFLIRWLCHKVDVSRPGGVNTYGEPVPGERLNQVPCLIDGSRTRVPTDGSQDRVVDYSLTFHREIAIDLQTAFENGRDADGNVLLEKARAVRIDPTMHPDLGELARTVSAVRN